MTVDAEEEGQKKNYQHLEDLGSNRDLECDHDVKVGPRHFFLSLHCLCCDTRRTLWTRLKNLCCGQGREEDG